MAQAVSRIPLTSEARVRSRSVYVGFVMDKVALVQVFPCQFHSTSAPLQGKTKKINHLHDRVAQEASRLRCVRSICYGALHKKKKRRYNVTSRCTLNPSQMAIQFNPMRSHVLLLFANYTNIITIISMLLFLFKGLINYLSTLILLNLSVTHNLKSSPFDIFCNRWLKDIISCMICKYNLIDLHTKFHVYIISKHSIQLLHVSYSLIMNRVNIIQ
jgi:hypothetical protein